MTGLSRSASGLFAEDTVARWLLSRGWALVARRWRKGPGELDIVGLKDDIVAFVEVKRVDAFGLEALEDSVGPDKRRRIVETAKLFLAYHRQCEGMALRFDLAAVRQDTVEAYIEGAFLET